MRRFARLFLIAAVLAVLFFITQVSAQDTPASDKPRNQKKEDAGALKNWIAEDVPYIATKQEKDAFDLLTTDEERENFIGIFWDLRDPTPDTEENEYRQEYYERIAYANENFSSGKPGWKTDRGRIYIAWGKPDSVESRPMGGTYDRPAWEGGGTTTTYPFEIWYYRQRDGLETGVEFEFVDPSGSGEYRLTTDPNAKDALLFVPGAGMTDRERLGLETRSDRIMGLNRGYQREQDSWFRRIENVVRANTPPPVAQTGLNQFGNDSPLIDNNPLDFDVRIDFFRQSEESVVTGFTILTRNSELVFEELGGLPTARLNVFGRILSVSQRLAGTFQDSVSTSVRAERLAEARSGSSIYQATKTLSPGFYKVTIAVTDIESGNRGIREIGFEVPNYDNESLSTSTIILASTLRTAGLSDVGGRFVIGGSKVIPNLTGEFRRGSDVGLYLQVYNAGIDQTTLRPAVDVEYVIYRGETEVHREKEDWEGLSDAGRRLTLARLFNTAAFEPGEYRIAVVISDLTKRDEGVIKSEAPFIVQ